MWSDVGTCKVSKQKYGVINREDSRWIWYHMIKCVSLLKSMTFAFTCLLLKETTFIFKNKIKKLLVKVWHK